MLYYRCVKEVRLLVLPNQSLRELEAKHEDKTFGREMLILKNKLLKAGRWYPCDYIVRMPKDMMRGTSVAALFRANALKNVVMRIVTQIREKK